MNVEVGADGLELRLTAEAGGADTRALGQFLKARVVPRAEGVARILAFRDGGDFESWGRSVGRAFKEGTARSTRPAARASSISLVNMPLVPTMARATSVILSPVVWMISISTSWPRARNSAEMWLACQRASWEPREPMRSFVGCEPFWESVIG